MLRQEKVSVTLEGLPFNVARGGFAPQSIRHQVTRPRTAWNLDEADKAISVRYTLWFAPAGRKMPYSLWRRLYRRRVLRDVMDAFKPDFNGFSTLELEACEMKAPFEGPITKADDLTRPKWNRTPDANQHGKAYRAPAKVFYVPPAWIAEARERVFGTRPSTGTRGHFQGLFDFNVKHTVEVNTGLTDIFSDVLNKFRENGWMNAASIASQVIIILRNLDDWVTVTCCVQTIVGLIACPSIEAPLLRMFRGAYESLKKLGESMWRKPTLQSSGDESWKEKASEIFVALFPYLGSIVTLIAGTFFLKGLPGKGTPDELLNRFRSFGPAIKTASDLASYGSTIANYFLDTIHWYIFGFEPKKFDSMASVDAWMNDVQQMMSVAASVDIKTSARAQAQADSLYTRGLTIAKEFDAMRVPVTQQTAFRQYLLAAAELRRLAHSSGAGYAIPRFEPVIVQLFGNSGVGKSTLTNALLIDCNRAEGLTNYADIVDRIYYRKVGQEFWDGFTSNHKFVVYDDFGQLQDTVLKPNQEFLELIYAGNNAPYPVHMAAIAEKASTFFQGGMILLTSNEPTFNVVSLTHPDAVRRRFDVRAQVRIAPEYGIPSVEGKGLRLDKSKCNLDPSSADFLKPYRFDVIKPGVFRNPIEEMDCSHYDLTYEEFSKIVIDAYLAKQDHSKKLLETLSAYASRPLPGPSMQIAGEDNTIPLRSTVFDDDLFLQIGSLDAVESEVKRTLNCSDTQYSCLEALMAAAEYACGKSSTWLRRFLQRFNFFEDVVILKEEDVNSLPKFNLQRWNRGSDSCQPLMKGNVNIEKEYLNVMPAIAVAVATGRFYRSSDAIEHCLRHVCKVYDLDFVKLLASLIRKWRWDTIKAHTLNLHQQVMSSMGEKLASLRSSVLDALEAVVGPALYIWVEYTVTHEGEVPTGRTSITKPLGFDDKKFWKYELRPTVKYFWNIFKIALEQVILIMFAVGIFNVIWKLVGWLFTSNNKKKSKSARVHVGTSGRTTEMALDSPSVVKRQKVVTTEEESFPSELEGYSKDDMKHARQKVEGVSYAREDPKAPRRQVEGVSYARDDSKAARRQVEGFSYAREDTRNARQKVEATSYSSDDKRAPRSKVEMDEFLENLREQELANRYELQGVVDANAASMCAKIVHRSLYRIEREVNGEWKHVLNVLFIKGRLAVTNAHFAFYLRRFPDRKMRITGAACMDGFVFSARDLKFVMTEGIYAERDVMLIEFPRAIRQHPDITSSIATSNDFSKYSSVKKVALVGYLPIPALLSQIHTTDKAVAFDKVLEADEPVTQSVVKVRLAFGYPIETAQGECGSVLLSMEPAMTHKILGLHSVGGAHHYYTGCATPLSLEMIKEMEARLQPRLDAVISLPEAFSDFEVSVKECESTLPNSGSNGVVPRKLVGQCFNIEIDQSIGRNFMVLGKADKKLSSSGRTEIRKSPIHGYVEPMTAPARLAPFRNEEGDLVCPEPLARKKADLAPSNVNEQHLKRAVADVQRMLDTATSGDVCKRVLSHAESIVGIDGVEWFDSINRKASAGRPWRDNLMLPNGQKSSGKHKWLSQGGLAGGDFRTDEPELLKAVEDRIAAAARGVRTPTIWCDTLKDERRPLDRVTAGKTRLFSVGPMDFNLAFRRYFLSFIAFVMDNRINVESCVGVNPFSREWTRVANRCTSKGNHIIAGDFSNFDGTLLGQILWAILDIINNWYDDGEVNAQVRRVLWSDIVHSIHQTGGSYYAWNHSQPSGNPATVIINCLYNSIAVRIAWLYCMENNPEYFHMKAFNDHVVMVAYGDDNVIGVSKDVHHLFNMGSLTAAFARFGMVYTDESKSGDVTAFRKLEEISFLKRGFRWDAEQLRYRAPLALKTIRDMVQFVRGDFDHEQLCCDNVEMALYELAQWDQMTFDRESRLMLDACRQEGLFPIVDTYEGYNERDFMVYVDPYLC